MRRAALRLAPGAVTKCAGYRVRINDGENFFVLYKDIFRNEIYRFDAATDAPRILDCGSNIGLSILYFKRLYPNARIVGFEPDPTVFPLLRENLERARLDDVELVQAALAASRGEATLYSDRRFASHLAGASTEAAPPGWSRHDVRTVTLEPYLSEPVDFLKMNIEGAEFEVLAAARERLHMVDRMVVEYHHLPGLPPTLHVLLALLHDAGFDYLVNDFDALTNAAVRPPFRLDETTRYFLLVYAQRSHGT